MTIHAEARKAVLEAFEKVFGRRPSLPEAQVLQGVAWLETNYGRGWKGDGKNSNNWGAIQRGKPPCDPANSFLYTDTSPNADGTSTPYSICFRKYATAEEGARDLAIIVYRSRPSVLTAAATGDLFSVSAALHATRYYEGFGKTVGDRISNHHKALRAAVLLQARAFNEPMPDGTMPPPPTLKRGSNGEYVKDLQRALNALLSCDDDGQHPDLLVVDGQFGPATDKRVRGFQSSKKLKVDGIVGPQTWAALESAAR